MNKEKFTRQIESIEVPEDLLIEREKAALFQAKKHRKRNRKTKQSGLIACGLIISLLGFGLISPGMAKTLSQVPIIGSIYAEFGDIASEKIEAESLATQIDQQDSHSGLTMNVKEAVYDGGRLVVTVEYEGDGLLSLDEKVVGKSSVTINGLEVETAASTSGQSSVDGNTIVESHQFIFVHDDSFADQIEVGVHGKDLFGKKGEWDVSFPLEKIKSNIQQWTSNVQATTKDNLYTITADKVALTPLATRIDLTVDYPEKMEKNDTWPVFMYIVTDDKGNRYKFGDFEMGVLEKGHHVVLALPPMDHVPKSLTIQPIDDKGQANAEETGQIKDLKLIVPLQ